MSRAAIYTRISKDREGNELGVERQEEDCRTLATRLGLDVVAEFRDNDISASTLSTKARPGYKAMLDRARERDFDVILAYSNSRLTRRVREYLDLIDLYRDVGVTVRTVVSGDHDLSTADGRAVALTLATWDQAEAERTGERIQRQKRQKAENGEWHGGAAPFGYSTRDKSLVRNDREVELIAEAASRLLDSRESLHSIVTDWNTPKSAGETAPKKPTRKGKHWRQSNLRAILRNRSLLGETKAGVVGWEPVIDRETFDRLGALFDDPSRRPPTPNNALGVKSSRYSMAGGLTVCGNCGKRLVIGGKPRPATSTTGRHTQPILGCFRRINGESTEHPTEDRKRTIYYKADGRPARAKADAVRSETVVRIEDTLRPTIDHDALEEHVFGKVLALLSNSDELSTLQKDRNVESNRARIASLERDANALRDRRKRAQDAYLDGIMEKADASSEVDRLNDEIAGIESQINDLLLTPAIAEFALDGFDWKSWTPGRRRAFLRLLIDRVVVDEVGHERRGALTARRRGESDEELAKRRHALRLEAVDARVTVVWKWEAEAANSARD